MMISVKENFLSINENSISVNENTIIPLLKVHKNSCGIKMEHMGLHVINIRTAFHKLV